MTSLLHQALAHPLTRGLSIDDPAVTVRRRQIIQSKAFLKKLYTEWYEQLARDLPRNGPILELGSGAGFFREVVPGAITSDVLPLPGIDRVVDAHQLPFADGELAAIVMINVFHHLPDTRRFIREASRCIRQGGVVAMIEPWKTPWSQWVYRRLHHEPFDPRAGWTHAGSAPLSDANGALPWIVFERDRAIFEREFPMWRIEDLSLHMPFAYLVSGGVSMRSLAPGWLYCPVRALEQRCSGERWAMFARIHLRRV